ncbi:MAG: histidine phosphatase family protein [Candidatus Promineofilum sp.]|nr:histidine phosphatase family protein [Promineifilum sp.]
MKRLLLLRHAKSSWGEGNLADYDRPLNDRGRHDAPRMGWLLRQEDLVPDMIITSSAKRAASTAELVAEAASFEGELRYTNNLYLAEPEAYIALARRVDEAVNTLMLVGHNPGIQELVALLTAKDERMATANLACVAMPIKVWSELDADEQYELQGVWRPREL